MASFYHTIPDSEDLVKCPYDPVHMIRMKRLQYHLMKCRKNFPNRAMSHCHFNNNHVVPEAELRFHLSTCPDRHAMQLLSKDAAGEAEGWVKGNTDVPTYFPDVVMPENGEDWDAEVSIPRIGVRARDVAGIGYYKSLTGLQKAQKKAYYNNLRTGDDDANVKMFEEFNTTTMPGEEEDGAGDFAAVNAAAAPKPQQAVQPVNTFAQPTLGRGRGRIAATRSEVKPGPAQMPEDLEDMKRLARRTKKKLKQITQLLERQATGELLNEEEKIKVAHKATYEFQYNTIMAKVGAAEKLTQAE